MGRCIDWYDKERGHSGDDGLTPELVWVAAPRHVGGCIKLKSLGAPESPTAGDKPATFQPRPYTFLYWGHAVQIDPSASVGTNSGMSLADAIDSGADAHKEAFPLSNCSKDCIKAQLDSYYKMCRGARPQMINAQSKQITPHAVPSAPPAPRGR